jgi:predicted outer membrane repeat protein
MAPPTQPPRRLGRRRQGVARPPQRFRPALEPVENRIAPATLTVNTADDNTTDTAFLTLREAITLVNNGGNPTSLGQSSLPAGWASQIAGPFGTNDTIQFAPGLASPIALTGFLPKFTANVTVTGPGSSLLTLQGNGITPPGNSGIFTVPSGVTASISGLSFTSATSRQNGGAIGSDGTLTLTDCRFTGNMSIDGGGVANNLGTLTATDCTFTGNHTTGEGGGLYTDGTATLTRCTFSGNSAAGGLGGAIGNDGVIVGTGGRTETGGTLTATECTFDGNSASEGGAIYNGGGIAVTGNGKGATLTLTGCTLSGNSAAMIGGGIVNLGGFFAAGATATGASATLVNCTIASNTAQSGSGGAIDNGVGTAGIPGTAVGGSVKLINDTITANRSSASTGAGLDNHGVASAVVENTIVAGNVAGSTPSDIQGVVDSASAFNLVGDASSAGGLHDRSTDAAHGNIVGNGGSGSLSLATIVATTTDASGNVIPVLANNGGPTLTVALSAGSPAIDAGSNALAINPATGQPLSTDQRGAGFPRILGNRVDVGAFESPLPSTPTPTPTPTTPLVTIANVSIQNLAAGRRKIQVIDVRFSGQVNAAPADNLAVYTLTTVPQGRRHMTRPVGLSRAIYASATETVMVIPKKSPIALRPPLILTINGSTLLDSLGRAVDGNGDGQPGGIYKAMLSKAGVITIKSVRPPV